MLIEIVPSLLQLPNMSQTLRSVDKNRFRIPGVPNGVTCHGSSLWKPPFHTS